MASKKGIALTIAVTPALKTAFDLGEIRGQGGFQVLMRDLSARVKKSGGVMHISPDDFKRITRYATTYGEGGFQQRLRLLVTQWATQHANTIVKG